MHEADPQRVDDKALRARREEPKLQRAAKPPSVGTIFWSHQQLKKSSMLEIEVAKDGFHCQQTQRIGKQN